jgi:IclR family acetate operon transcriptional repressor
LFEALAKRPEGLSLSELSAVLESPKSSLLNLLKPLVAQSYLTHTGGLYGLGPAIFRLSADIMVTRKFPNLLRPMMEELVARSRESVFLAVLDRNAELAVYIECVDSPQPVRYTVPVGSARPLYATAAGRLLLAFQPPAWRDRYVSTVKLKPFTPRTITDRKALRSAIEDIRREGIAISVGEMTTGAAGIAAPVLAGDGSIAAAIQLSAPADRFEQSIDRFRKMLLESAGRASGATSALGTPSGYLAELPR